MFTLPFPEDMVFPGISPQEPVSPKVEETAENKPEVTPETPEEIQVPPVLEAPKIEDDLSQYSRYAKIGMSLKDILPESVEVPKDLDAQGFKDWLWAEARKAQVADEEAELQRREAEHIANVKAKGLDDETLMYAHRIAKGGDPNVVSQHAQYMALATAPLENEEEWADIVRAGLEVQGNNPDLIETYMTEKMKDTETLKKTAAGYQKFFAQLAEKTFKDEDDRQRAVEKAAEEREAEYAKSVSQYVTNGFAGLKIPKAEQSALIDYMTKKDVPIDTVVNGRPKRVYISKMAADSRALATDYEKLVTLAHYMRGGMTGLVNAAHKAANDKFLDGVDIEEEVQRKEDRAQATVGGGQAYLRVGF